MCTRSCGLVCPVASELTTAEDAANVALRQHWPAVLALTARLQSPPMALDGWEVVPILEAAMVDAQAQQGRDLSF
jgi:hypothetical protein